MHLSSANLLPLLAASAPLAAAQLDVYAKAAGLKYFGAATDTPGQRERAGLEAAYPQYDAILADNNEFSQTTPTNGMKWLFTEPERGVFNWTEGDITADLAEAQGKTLRCHALVWHSQLAPWVEAKKDWTPAELEQVIIDHVTAVAGHYKGRCYAWDVVNEALEEDGSWRKSVFYNVLGEDYIKLAFRVAAEVDPEAKLYYNDYNIERPSGKADGAVRIVKMVQDAGLRIDGVGLQAHFVAHRSPSLDEQIAVMNAYGALGVETSYTELDVRIQLPLNETNLEWQKAAYRDAAGACAQAESCIGITLWDFYDAFSWVPYVFPGEGAPTLWFDDFTRHPAYYGVLAAFKNATGACSNKKRGLAQLFAA
jgi:endo-1,4-beta-xylanase